MALIVHMLGGRQMMKLSDAWRLNIFPSRFLLFLCSTASYCIFRLEVTYLELTIPMVLKIGMLGPPHMSSSCENLALPSTMKVSSLCHCQRKLPGHG
ncbi:hypothetical protein Y1Q_0001063 [Alligator mississippiensis]|uniref:Uncharacterized protein n=1 Tax=Alligator mississippiensis TaxID=8496 RepID=A0A151NEH7_ALLMI|nr:hypothetical protein Y1Q_0001063 [Alligator mississippiensis]